MTETRTTLYRPDAPEGLMAETLSALTDMRVRDEMLEAVKALPDHLTPELSWSRHGAVDEGDTGTLLASLRLLLPSEDGIGERWFRVQHGWSGEEIAHIASLMRATDAGLRFHADRAVLDGTAKVLRADADRVDRLVEKWIAVGRQTQGGDA